MADGWQDMAGTDTLSASRPTLNDGLTELTECHIGTTEPTNRRGGMLWVDSNGTGSLKIRNPGNTAWRTIVPDLSLATGGVAHLNSSTFTQPVAGVAATAAAHFPRSDQIDSMVFVSQTRLGGITASDQLYIFNVPVASRVTIDAVYVLCDTTTSGSDGSNNWSFMVRNLTAAEDLMSAAKTTNGSEITGDTPYLLPIDQNNTKSDLAAANELIELQVTKNGTPTGLGAAEIVIQVNYKVALF